MDPTRERGGHMTRVIGQSGAQPHQTKLNPGVLLKTCKDVLFLLRTQHSTKDAIGSACGNTPRPWQKVIMCDVTKIQTGI